MTLAMRKIIVIAVIATVFVGANIVVIANWLAERGVEEKANYLKENFLTGTALTVVLCLLILLVAPKNGSRAFGFSRICPVCDRKVRANSNYCSECGSKI